MNGVADMLRSMVKLHQLTGREDGDEPVLLTAADQLDKAEADVARLTKELRVARTCLEGAVLALDTALGDP